MHIAPNLVICMGAAILAPISRELGRYNTPSLHDLSATSYVPRWEPGFACASIHGVAVGTSYIP